MVGKVKVLENSFLYTLSSLLVRAVNFFLLPVYTLFLKPEDYGTINIINSFTQVASFVVAFSLYSAVIRFYADYKNDKEKLKRFYGTVVVFVFMSGVVFTSLGFLLNEYLISCFFKGINFYPVFLIALLNLTFICLHMMHGSILQGMQKGRKLTIINLSVFGIQVCLNLFFIMVLKLGATGILLAGLIINLSYFFFMLFDLVKNNIIFFCIDIKILREALRYSVPIIPHNLSTRIANFASRVFINNSSSLTTVGLYSVASQFGLVIDMVQSSVNRAFAPWFYDMMNIKEESNKDIVKFSRFLLILYSILYMLIGLFSQEVIMLMTTERYIIAWTVIPILVVAFSVKSLYYFYVNVLFYYKDAAKKIFIATITGSSADLFFAFILIPQYGMYGAAVSFLIAKVIVVTIIVIMSKKYDDIGYKVTDMLKIVTPSLLFMSIGLYFSYTKYIAVFSWINLFYKFGVLIVYLIFVYLTNKKKIKEIIKSGKIQQVLNRKTSQTRV